MWIANLVYGYARTSVAKAGRRVLPILAGCRLRELCSIQRIADHGDVDAKSGEDQRRFCFFCGGGRSIHAFPGHESESWNDIDFGRAGVRGGWLAGSCMRVRAGHRHRWAASAGRVMSCHAAPADGRMKGLVRGGDVSSRRKQEEQRCLLCGGDGLTSTSSLGASPSPGTTLTLRRQGCAVDQ
ncbi:hypothetical protein B0H13DRAFT_179466 [Mycena leptocephala]|nr:hypothetical protein B0H13DRAFT_179466 [Mycena leptocephala]